MLNELEKTMLNAESLPFLKEKYFLEAFFEICEYRDIVFGNGNKPNITNLEILIKDFFKTVDTYRDGSLAQFPEAKSIFKYFFMYFENNT